MTAIAKEEARGATHGTLERKEETSQMPNVMTVASTVNHNPKPMTWPPLTPHSVLAFFFRVEVPRVTT